MNQRNLSFCLFIFLNIKIRKKAQSMFKVDSLLRESPITLTPMCHAIIVSIKQKHLFTMTFLPIYTLGKRGKKISKNS